MDKALHDQNIYEKESFINMLVGARLQEIRSPLPSKRKWWYRGLTGSTILR